MSKLSLMPRQTSTDYPGVVCSWGDFRLIVGAAADGVCFYRLHALLPVVGARAAQWVAIDRSSSPTLAKLLAKLAASTVGLADAVRGLPDDPALASPAYNAAAAAQAEYLGSMP